MNQSATQLKTESIETLLQGCFQLQKFRPGQKDIINAILQGQDTLAVMPTGGGKSLCYQLPALYQPGIVVVVSPLISLMKDQVRSLKALGIGSGCLYSGQESTEKQSIFSELKSAKNYLLFLSPERVQKPGFATWIKNQSISLFAIDESHCISQWGHDFREDYQKLKLLRELKPNVPILALTATATPQVLWDISKCLNLYKPQRHIYGFYRPNLYYQVEFCENDPIKLLYIKQALQQTPRGRIIIYCGTRKKCEALEEALKEEFPALAFYHAGLNTRERHRIQQDYDEGRIRILIATNAFGMGIDHPDVRLVVHQQMPANIESLYQEMGRAGRDGQDSTCLMLYAKKDRGLHSFFIRESGASESILKRRWHALNTITQFAEGAECRHAGILTYFRDATRLEACGHCDVCAPNSARRILRPEFSVEVERKVRESKRRQRKAFNEEPLDEAAQARAKKIQTWRREYAASKDVPAFLVFSNKSLMDLARKNPKSLEEMEAVYGLGPKKIEEFGELLLEL